MAGSRRHRFTKILATLGPASTSKEQIQALFDAGADVFRLNFSHGTHAEHQARYDVIRHVEAETGRPIAILADLQGPKLRVGTFKNDEVQLIPGAVFRLDMNPDDGDEQRVHLPHPEIFQALEVGSDLLLDDGKIKLTVREVGADFAVTEVVNGGPLSARKGVNVPDALLPVSALSAKDREDLEFALSLGVDWVALSFVQRPEDILEARAIIKDRAPILTKLEKPTAIQHLVELVKLSDAIMVARGDLGVEMPPEQVPTIQKQIIKTCRAMGKPVVVATQMLDSMVHAPTPTRAEASDVATAVYDSADAVMLSAESAVGSYATESVAMMNRIITQVEQDSTYLSIMNNSHGAPNPTVQDAITLAARQIAETIGAKCIATYTASGSTTLRASRERPNVPVICITSALKTARRMALAWGVHPYHVQEVERFSDVVGQATDVAQQEGFAQEGDMVAITAGVPMGQTGSTNVVRVELIT